MRCRHYGMSLIEMLVVIAIISGLLALIFPAVQSSREASRRTACMDNLHNQAAALIQYHDANGRLPPGRVLGAPSSSGERLDFSWAALVLPQLENASLFRRLDLRLPWSASPNLSAVETSLAIFRCPSSVVEFPGDTDYAGVLGSAMNTLSRRRGQGEAVFNRGLLINSRDFRGGVRFGQVTDGLSCTLVVVECGDVAQEDGGYWASGINCVSHDAGTVNSDPTGMFSLHPGGAHGARADGSVSFYSEDVEPLTLGALCTRASDDGPQ